MAEPTQLATVQTSVMGTPQQDFTDEQVNTLKRTIASGASDDEFSLFIAICQRTGLDPFARQIWAIKRKRWNAEGKEWEEFLSTETSIDGLRLIAQRTGERDGEDEPEWIDGDGAAFPIWLKSEAPFACRVRVYRRGHHKPYVGIAYYKFYRQTKGRNGELTHMWEKGGPSMLAKCAEALALRKGFPNELGGLYTSEEMAQADTVVIGEPETAELQARNRNKTEAWAEEPLKYWSKAREKHKRASKDRDDSSDEAAAAIEGYETEMKRWWLENGFEFTEFYTSTNDSKANYPLTKLLSTMLATAKYVGANQGHWKEFVEHQIEEYTRTEEPVEPDDVVEGEPVDEVAS